MTSSFPSVKNFKTWICPQLEFFWPVFSRIWTEYGDIRSISLYSVRMQENMYLKNSEYGQFLRSKQLQSLMLSHSQLTFTYSKSTIETLEQCMNYVQS